MFAEKLTRVCDWLRQYQKWMNIIVYGRFSLTYNYNITNEIYTNCKNALNSLESFLENGKPSLDYGLFLKLIQTFRNL